MKDAVRATHGPQVLGGVGGFAGLYDASALTRFRRPLLATSTDGVGTKVAIAQALDIHDTIGFDLVGMVVDDIVVVGAEPLFMTDYIATGRVVPERIADVVRGIAAACSVAGTALVGGETAEHPGLLAPDEYDVAGAATGVVEADELLGPERVRAGDVLVALGVERPALQRLLAGARRGPPGGLGAGPARRRAGPHARRGAARADARVRLRLPRARAPRGRRRSARVQPRHGRGTGVQRGARAARGARRGHRPRRLGSCRRSSRSCRSLGQVPWTDLEGTLNLGVGMVAIVAPDALAGVLAHAAELGLPAWELGTRPGRATPTTDVAGAPGFVAGTKGVHGGAVLMRGPTGR